jgi:glutaconate CoA-transferase subunit B
MSAVDTTSPATTGEIQTIVAARRLTTAKVVFIGVGKPSTAAILARSIHNPELVLVYESGTIGAKPHRVPLSIGDGELAETADAVVAVPEMFNYWVGPGRIDVAFLGAAQVDRYGNLNSTVIGDYDTPRTRLPGAGGAPEIAGGCGEVVVVAPHTTRTFVDRLDFVTTVGHADPRGELGWAAAGRGGDGAPAADGAPVGVTREDLGFRGRGPSAVITDLGVLEPDPGTKELTLVQLHPGATVEQAQEATGWDLKVAADVATTDPPTAEELHGLRELVSR